MRPLIPLFAVDDLRRIYRRLTVCKHGVYTGRMKTSIPGWQSVKTAATSAGCSTQRIYQLIEAGRIDCVQLGDVKLVQKPLKYKVNPLYKQVGLENRTGKVIKKRSIIATKSIRSLA